MDSDMKIQTHLLELARDLFFCAILIAAGSSVATADIFDRVAWLKLFAGWFIIVLGLLGAAAVIAIALTKVFDFLDGWQKILAIIGIMIVSAVGIAAFVMILNLPPGLF